MLRQMRYLKKSISKQFSGIAQQAHFYSAKAKAEPKASKLLRIDEEHGVREIVLNNPKTRNSLSKEMITALKEAIEHKQDDISLRAIVLSAKGKVWSAGHNLKEIEKSINEAIEAAQAKECAEKEKLEKMCEEKAKAEQCGTQVKPKDECEDKAKAQDCEAQEKPEDKDKDKAKECPPANVFEQLFQLIQTIMKCPVPVVAKIDGYTAAAGLQLAASCDVTICTKQSQFAAAAVHVGLFGATPAVAISRLIPRSKALYMLFTGLPMSADEAYINGLVSKVVPNGMVDEAVEDFTMDLKKVSRAVIEHGKLTFYKSLDMPLDKAYAAACEAMVKNLEMPDAQEGVKSFLEKRKPKWTHKMRA